MAEQSYELMHKDDVVASLQLDDLSGAILKVAPGANPELLPLGGSQGADSLRKWWLRRAVPISQGNIAALLQQEGIPCVPLCRGTDRAAIQIEPGISVQAFMVPHLGEEYRSVPHVWYLLSFDGRPVLFPADSDYLHEDFSRLAGTPLYAVFLNPLFYQAYYNTRLFHGHFDTDTLCVYHVPFPEDDGMHMQDMARRMPRGAADSGLRVLPLTEPMQQIEL